MWILPNLSEEISFVNNYWCKCNPNYKFWSEKVTYMHHGDSHYKLRVSAPIFVYEPIF